MGNMRFKTSRARSSARDTTAKGVATMTKLVTSPALIANGLKTFINKNTICSGSHYISSPPSRDLELTDNNREKKWLLLKLKHMTTKPAS
jgi:hypothetical protein